jgi:hypothetical protein
MTRRRKGHSARAFWLLGAFLALNLAVVIPIHLNHRFSPASNAVHAGLHTAHHTVIDRIDGRLEAQIDRASRTVAPKRIPAAVLFAPLAPGALPQPTAARPPVRRLRRLRIARSRAGDDVPSGHASSLRI